jgi:amino acid permease
MASSTSYDAQVIQEFADRLYAQARTIIAICTIVGVLAGLFVAVAASNAMGDSGGIGAVVGFAFCTALGFAIGKSRAFRQSSADRRWKYPTRVVSLVNPLPLTAT